VRPKRFNVKFDGLSNVLNRLFPSLALTDATGQAGHLSHPKPALSMVHERLSHPISISGQAWIDWCPVPQSPAFFALLFDFADALAKRIGEPSEELLWRYTPLPRSLGIGEPFDESNEKWREFMAGLLAAGDHPGYAQGYYAKRVGPDPQLGDPSFHGHRLFGPFYYELRAGGVIRPHVAKLQPYSSSPLDPERRDESRLRRL